MATLKITTDAPLFTQAESTTTNNDLTLWGRCLSYADSQKQKHTMWFMISLMVQGVFFLPVPAALMYYFDAPIIVLAVTMTLFFTNLIMNMGGAGIRTTLITFALTVLIHIGMVLAFVL